MGFEDSDMTKYENGVLDLMEMIVKRMGGPDLDTRDIVSVLDKIDTKLMLSSEALDGIWENMPSTHLAEISKSLEKISNELAELNHLTKNRALL